MVCWTEKYCHNCFAWEWTGVTLFSGYCALYSCSCATAILNKKREPPPRFLSMEKVYGKEQNREVSQARKKEMANRRAKQQLVVTVAQLPENKPEPVSAARRAFNYG